MKQLSVSIGLVLCFLLCLPVAGHAVSKQQLAQEIVIEKNYAATVRHVLSHRAFNKIKNLKLDQDSDFVTFDQVLAFHQKVMEPYTDQMLIDEFSAVIAQHLDKRELEIYVKMYRNDYYLRDPLEYECAKQAMTKLNKVMKGAMDTIVERFDAEFHAEMRMFILKSFYASLDKFKFDAIQNNFYAPKRGNYSDGLNLYAIRLGMGKVFKVDENIITIDVDDMVKFKKLFEDTFLKG